MNQNNSNLISKYWKNKLFHRDINIGLKNKNYNVSSISINHSELNYFNKLTNNNPVAQYTVIIAIYNFLLKRLVSEFDGFIISNFKNQSNSLPLSFSTDLNLSFKGYLQTVKLEILDTLNNADFNKDVVAQKTGFEDFSLLSHYGININSNSKLDSNGVLFNVKINEKDDIEIQVSYLEGFVKKTIVDYLVLHFKDFIINLENNIEVNLSEYPLLSENEKHQLLVDFNDNDVAYPKDKTIVTFFEEQVAKTPYNVAVVFGEAELTYVALNEKANQLANYISSKHTINKGDIIGVFLPKSDVGIVSLLAILKLGAVYLPIDTNYPQKRIDYLIKDSGLKLLIRADAVLKNDNCDILSVNLVNLEHYSSDNINASITSKDLAYVIYTSGSTGQPKGVMVEHTSNVNMSLDQIRSFEITESDKVVWFASVAFDASISEIMMSLYSGATLCIPSEETIKYKDQFIGFLKETKASVVTFPPSYLGLLSEKDISGLRCIITAGESANPTKAIAVLESGIDYYNAYGPTECAVCVSFYKVTKNDSDKSIIPIGSPISNTQVYILDESLQPLPIGVTGKLYVSGAGVARGYLNKPELTAEKFISNPFIKGTRMYDTGDLGRWLPDGNIEFLGRNDHQVKIRGYRIELGEIETAISQYSEELQQIVVEAKEINQDKTLVAYYVSKTEIDKSELRTYLQNKLPEYMVPGFYVEIESLPLTPNGKIDRKALPSVSGEDIIKKEYVAPRNAIEEKMVEIWQEVLGVQKIGITDNFFELGGHSLIIAQVINRTYKQLGKTVSFKAFFTSPIIEGLSKQLLENYYLAIPKAQEALSYPLTASQNRLWVLSQLEESSLAYNMPATVKLTGTVDVKKFKESFRLLIKRHEILRTYFKTNEEGEVQQHVAPTEKGKFKITEKDYSSVENQEEEIANYLQEKNSQSFDLEHAPLIRASLIKLREDEHVFFLSLHHIIGDGWSIELLIAEVVKTYNVLMQGKQANLQELNIQYKDYAVWFNSELQQEKYKVSEQYWLEQFTGEIPVLDLPSFKARPLVQTYNGNNVNHKFSIAFLEKLKTFSKQYDVTLFMTLMAGINALLHRYTGQNDIIIGTPIAGREHPDLENQMGLYLNTLAIRTQLKEQSNFLDLVAIQKETLLSAYDHQNYPFDALLGKLKLKRDTSRSALFDVLVVLQNQGQLNNLNIEELINLEVSNYEFKNKTSQLDISFTFVEAEGLDLTIEYNTDIYDEYLIERMFLHFENLLTESLEQPERLIQDVDYLTDKEKQQLLVDFNDTKVDYPKDKTIIDLFEEQVDKTPDNIAVVFEEVQLTYKELNEKTNQLANYLLKFSNLSKGDFIGISIERSEFLIISLFGILKAGYGYVLIDTSLPLERFNYILNDSKSKLLIDNRFREETRNVLISESKEKPNNKINLDDIVYLMYTSGSTGNPKGAINIYKGFTNTVKWYAEKINERDRIGIISNLSFDLTQKNYFAPLIVGASIHIDSDFDPISTKKFIKKQQITVINCAPTLFYSLLEENQEDLISLKKVILGGESIKLELIRDFLKKYDVDIFNSYGPSEASDVSVEYQLKKEEIDLIPIGKPIRNTKIFILDKELNQVPIGVIGEICIGGIGLGLGYLDNDKFTKDKFICTSKYGNVYKSGDSGRWLPDGNIEFLGRNDHQVKIRGYRIELGEIETFILKYSKELIQVAVEAKEMNQEKILVAYLVSGSEINKSDLRSFLQERLPYYMVPGFYVEIESLPLTPSGKIDRKALPSVSGEDIIKKEYVAPRNAIEQKMVEIWQEVLGVQKIGITDNFFELGGHSLIVVQVINQIFKQLGKKISFKIFFANPTIKALNKQLKQSEYLRIPKAAEALFYPLTASQSRLWILSQLENGSLVYNMPGAVRLIGAIDINRFEDSFRLLILGHEILRTYFKKNEKELISQYITPIEQVNFRISEIDFSAVENQEEVVANYLQEKNNEPFILEQAPLLRTSLIKLGENEHLFFLTMHHIIGDGWSMELLIAEIIQTYNALTQGKQVNLPELTIQYKDYAVWLNDELQQEKLKSSEDFWLNQFSGELPVLDLPSFKKRPSVQTYNGASLIHEFSKPFLDKLKSFSEKHQSTLFMTLMTGVKVLLHKYSGQDDIVVGTPIAGREHPDLEHQIGLYLNTLAIRTLFKEQNSFLDLLNQEKETLLGAYEHQAYPFDALIKKLNLKKDTSRSTLFDVIVVLQNQKQLKNLNNEELIGIEVNEYSFLRKTSQFDIRFAFTEKDGLELMIDYNTDIYDVNLIERMFHHFENLMNGLLDETTKDIQEVEFLTEIEKFQVISEFNNTIVSYPNDKTIVTLFEEQVINTPDNIAVVFGNISLTYKELNEKVNQLAHYLRNEYFIEPNDLVGIKLDRSEQMIIAILSVLKSGAAYVPIDTNYPQERIAYIEKDINCKVIVDEDELALFNLQRFRFNIENPNLTNSTSDLAYVIYTSGSTGEPKGVMVEHGNVIRLVKPCSYFPLSTENILLSTGSVSFDATTIEYFGTLLNGSRLILTTQNNLLDLSKLEDVVKTHKVNSLWMTASWFSQVVESNIKIFENIDQLIIGGDVVSPKHTEKVFERYPAIKIVNGYGPTENTTFSTTFEIQNVKYTTIPIGKPIPNSSAYILNKNLQPVVTGVIGQLYVSGAGVARGYLNKAELTAEKFIPNPFVQGERLYDTGDLCKWLPDGNIEFLGRKDQQVKIRGFRIELVEIENIILQYSANFNQVLVAVKEMHQEKVLVAYLVASHDFDKNELRDYLQSKLPDYMIPGFYIVLDKLPLTSNGKINYKALPNISDNDIIRKEFVGPSNEIEEQLVEIWKEVLGVGKIGITDNFFNLGGDSIRSIRLLSRINNFLGLNYKLSDIYAFPSIRELLSLKLERLTSTISPSIKLQIEGSFENLSKELDSEKIISIFPMSDIEQGMLYSSFLNTNLGVYHDQFLIPIPIQDFDESIFIIALELLVEKHEILRVAFNIDNYSVPVHLVYKNIDIALESEDISTKDKKVQQELINEFMIQERTEKPFDISIPGLWRMKIYKLGEQQWHLLFQFHHAILDGWSLASLITELNNTYISIQKEGITTLEKLSLSYKDYVFNQKCIKEIDNQYKYWKEKLNGYKRLDIFTEEVVFNHYNFVLEGKLYNSIQEFVVSQGISMKIVSFSAYLYTLQMVTYDNDVLAGLVTNGRPLLEDSDKILGCFLNTLPFRLNGTKGTILDFVKQVNHFVNVQKQFEGISLFELHTRFSLNNQGENPFFDTFFNYIDFHIFNDLNLQETNKVKEFEFTDINFTLSNTFLDLTICPIQAGINISWHQQRVLKGGITVEQLHSYYYNFLNLLVTRPNNVLNKEVILSQAEKQQLLVDFNDTKVDYPKDKTIIDLFEQQVDKTPDNIAVVFEEVELTYKQLNEKANQLAHYLRETYKIQADDLIAIKLERSEQMILAILGILKSGAAYVPIDPSYPQERITYIEKDSNCKIVIDEQELGNFYKKQKQYTKSNALKINKPNDLAYVIYTSGTTGNPKGVMVEHKNIVNIISNQTKEFNIKENENIAQFSNIAFDASVEQIFLAILNGASLTIINKDTILDIKKTEDFIENKRITHFHAVPIILEKITPKKYPFLKRIISGGDICPIALANKWSKYCNFYNKYGPTETTVTAIEILYNKDNVFSIGKPISNTQIYILDESLQPLPIGVTGKLYISGAGVARGYLNKPELTAEKFISNPFIKGTRMYDTGDLGRWLPDGNIEFLGRNDHQVKIRGYRIELGEIETAISQYSKEIQQIVVEAKEINQDKTLVAYYVSKTEIDKSEIRTYLQNKLPEYMVPIFYVQLVSLPLTPNGKIDRRALPEVDESYIIRKEFVAPRNETEEKLAAIWQEVLVIEKVGITDNFLDLGGNSLSAIRLISLIHKEFDIKMPINELFKNMILEEQAYFIMNVSLIQTFDLEDNSTDKFTI